jgi:hypothetical protein
VTDTDGEGQVMVEQREKQRDKQRERLLTRSSIRNFRPSNVKKHVDLMAS